MMHDTISLYCTFFLACSSKICCVCFHINHYKQPMHIVTLCSFTRFIHHHAYLPIPITNHQTKTIPQTQSMKSYASTNHSESTSPNQDSAPLIVKTSFAFPNSAPTNEAVGPRTPTPNKRWGVVRTISLRSCALDP